MSWCALDVRATETLRPDIARWLVRRTGQAVEERTDGSLIGVTTNDAVELVLGELRAAFTGVSAAVRSLPDEDWTSRWREGLGARQIGRLTIAPSWAADSQGNGRTVVIDPQTAFGTGEHGSTRTMLQLLDRWVGPGHRVLDLGSGSGILSIAAVKLGAARAIGVDIDPEAEAIARANAEVNGTLGSTDFLTGDAGLLAGLLGPVELVLSNILRLQNEALLPVIRTALAPGGLAVFGGMEEPEAEAFGAALGGAGFDIVDHAIDQGWWGVAARSG
jgi:ribosomal protein L11 methyltransferase